MPFSPKSDHLSRGPLILPGGIPVQQSLLAYLSLVIGILCLSMSAIFIRWADAPGLITTFYRMAFGTLLIFPVFLRNSTVKGHLNFKILRWIPFALLGGLCTSLDHAIWSVALAYSKIANVTLLNYISPLWVALFALIFWKEKLRRLFWLGLLFTFSGATVIFGYDLFMAPHLGKGDILALFSSLFFASYILVSQKGRQHLDTLTYVWFVTLASTISLLIINLVGHNSFTGYSPSTYLAFVGAALVPQTLGYFSIGYAQGHLPAHIISPTMIAQPVLTGLLAIPLTGEALTPGVLLGGTLALAGIYIINRSHNRDEKND
jgi:drug/metabolite transporter (DMT)-like permease